MNPGSWRRSPQYGGSGHGRHGRGGARRLKRGILKFVLLKLVAEQSRHGYDMIREFRRKGWSGGPGSIYPILAQLEEDGLITGRDEGERKVYDVTELGREHLREHPFDASFLFEPADEEEAGAQEFDEGDVPDTRMQAGPPGQLREAADRLMQAVSSIGPASKPETIDAARALLDRVRKEIYTLLAQE